MINIILTIIGICLLSPLIFYIGHEIYCELTNKKICDSFFTDYTIRTLISTIVGAVLLIVGLFNLTEGNF